MNFRLLLEWDEQCGILLSKMYPLIDGVENALRQKSYGASIDSIGAIMICRPRDFKQRKRFKKDTRNFAYDILLDYYLIKNVTADEKKGSFANRWWILPNRRSVPINLKTLTKLRFCQTSER